MNIYAVLLGVMILIEPSTAYLSPNIGKCLELIKYFFFHSL